VGFGAIGLVIPWIFFRWRVRSFFDWYRFEQRGHLYFFILITKETTSFSRWVIDHYIQSNLKFLEKEGQFPYF
jgi:hypothetical protein